MVACKRSVCLWVLWDLMVWGRVSEGLLGFRRAGVTKALSQAEQPLWALGWDPVLALTLVIFLRWVLVEPGFLIGVDL